jgi:hypothetical protein
MARISESRGIYRDLVENSEGKRPLGESCVVGKLTLISYFMKWNVEAWPGLIWPRIGTVGDHQRMR